MHFKASEMVNILEIHVFEVHKEVIKPIPFMLGCQSSSQTSFVLTLGYTTFN